MSHLWAINGLGISYNLRGKTGNNKKAISGSLLVRLWTGYFNEQNIFRPGWFFEHLPSCPNILRKTEKSSKVRQNRKTSTSVFTYFLSAIAKNPFLQGRLGTELCHLVFYKILKFNLFSNSWDSVDIKFLVQDIKFRFTCSDGKYTKIFYNS